MLKRTITAFFLAAFVASAPAAEPLPGTPPPPKLPVLDPAKLTDPKEAARAADQLEKDFPASDRPEAVKMLLAILRGDWLTGTGGWFGPAESRFGWKWLADQHGVDPVKGEITREKFHGPKALFARLDRDGDGRIAADDFDWSETNPYVIQSNLTTRFFRRMNPRGDGKLTQEDMEQFFKRVADGKRSHHARRTAGGRCSPADPTGSFRAMRPSVEMLVRGLYSGELGSIHEGPKVGATAPDFAAQDARRQRKRAAVEAHRPEAGGAGVRQLHLRPVPGAGGRGRCTRQAVQGRGDVRDGLRARSAPDRRLGDGVEQEGGCGSEAADDLRRAASKRAGFLLPK